MEKEPELFICACHNTEHQFVVHYDEDEKLIYVHVSLLNYRNFWKRLIHGVKYIFGHKSIYGDFDEFILNEKYGDKFIKIGKFLKGE